MKLNLFISYSHKDAGFLKDFKKHMAPLETNELIEIWHDKKIKAGKSFRDIIDLKLEDSDIICLLISANFLSSEECMKEKANALELIKKKGTAVVPIILSQCGWKDDIDITHMLALPTDGDPISDFKTSAAAWNNVYENLKNIIESEIKIKQLKIKDDFSGFLQNTELLSKAHSQKNEVMLKEIFVYPELSKFDDLRGYDKKIGADTLLEEICDSSKILIAGENQSGKTTLCKILFLELREKNYIPVYVFDKAHKYHGKLENRISRALKQQYENIVIEDLEKSRIVPIIDDFHLDRKSTRLNSSHIPLSRMPSSA